MKKRIRIERPGNIRDKEVLGQIPEDLLKRLGEVTAKDFQMKNAERTLTFEKGTIKYRPYHSVAEVVIKDED